MSEKAKKILDVASQLFFDQGYRGTNMQTIADNCGISKGSIYLHFKSKEQILIALLKRMDDELLVKIDKITLDNSLSPREKFKAQVRCQIDLSNEHKQLHDLFLQDSFAFTEELHKFAGDTRYRWQIAQQQAVEQYYGKEIVPWKIDISLLLSGMLNEYASYWLIENVDLPQDPAIEMVVFACDVIAQGLVEKRPNAVLTASIMPNQQSLEAENKARRQAKIETLSIEVGIMLARLSDTIEKNEWQALEQTGEMIKQQITAKKPDLIILRALLASVREYPSLTETRQEIARLFSVKLI